VTPMSGPGARDAGAPRVRLEHTLAKPGRAIPSAF
jgi:hypothetical protein